MEIILLGERVAIPYYSRSIASLAVRFDNYKEACLFDCGEGTQNYLLQSGLKTKQIKRIILSELNSTTCLGIIGLLATFSLNERLSPLEIYAPQGFCKYLRLFSRYSQTNFSYPIKIFDVRTGIISQFFDYKIIALSLASSPEIFGYSIIEKEKPGKFRIQQAQFLKIPSGPIYGHLKKHNKFVLTNGLIIDGKHLCELPKRGRKFTYLAKYGYSRSIVELAWKADVLFINSIFQKYLRYKIIYSEIEKRISKASHVKFFLKLNLDLKQNYSIKVYSQSKTKANNIDCYYPLSFKIKSNYCLEKI